MADFNGICKWTLRFEDSTLSGKVVVLDDGAGQTRFGISSVNHPDIDSSFYTTDAASALDMAIGYYHGWEWKQIWGDQISDDQPASVLYDFAVNSGVKRAVKTLQAVLGFDTGAQDGAFGPITLAKMNDQDPGTLAANLRQARYNWCKYVADNNPDDEKYLENWEHRSMLVYPDNGGL